MKMQFRRKFSSCLALAAGSLLWLAALAANAQAPASIAGKTFALTINDGTPPFASSGSVLFLVANSGNSFTYAGTSGSGGSGSCTYNASNSDGFISGNDSVVGAFKGDFSFSDTASGTYSLTQTSSNAVQDGSFVMLGGTAPASLSGKTLTCTITGGGGQDPSSGTFAISFTASGYTMTQGSSNSTGSYSFSLPNSSTATIQATRSGEGHTTTAMFAFAISNAGEFLVTNSVGDYETGTFIILSIPDTTPPANQIISPASGTQLTNGLVTVQDRATDGAGVSFVEYYLNGQDFGSGVAGTSNSWTMNFALPAGTNTIQTVSTDTSGNNSTTNSIKLVYLNKQTNANLITFTDHWLDTAQTNSLDDILIITQDTALLNVALAVPGLHNLPDSNWSNLVLAMSLGDLNFDNTFNGANVLTATNATFFDTQTDLSGNPVCYRQFTVTRSGDMLIIAANIENPTYSYPNSIMADQYLGRGGAIQDQQQFTLSLSDGSSPTNYANVAWTVFISGTDSTNSDGIGDELDNVQVFGTADFIAPTNQITAPTPGLLVSNANYTVTGKTVDNVGVTAVYYSLNNGGWNSAATTNNWTNWTAAVAPLAGTNTIAAYAVDMGGNISPTNTVSFVYVVSAVLTVNTNGHGTLSPNYNGALLEIGKSYSMKATASTGFKFTGWSGSTNSTNATLTFLMDSNLTFTANFADSTAPTLAVTAPKSGLSVSNAAYTATGTAGDNVGVISVSYQLNGGLWVPATTSNGYTNWSANLALVPGTNTFKAYASDAAGNNSATQSVSFVYVLSAPLTVSTNGHGTVSPNYNGALLEIDKSYSIKATAATGFKFTGWSGSTNSTNATLTFLMDSNLTFTANFADSTAPTLAITTPKAGLSVSNAAFTATGTAKDNVGVTSVLFQLNSGLWVPASTTNGYTNWSANLNLSPGTNTLKAYALDGNNDSSTTNTVSFVYVVSAVLTVNTNGHGAVSPNYNGALLELGKSYSIKATAASGFKFNGWSGSTNSTNATLTFLMDSNLTFTANFADSTAPTLAVTTPKSGLSVSNAAYIATGTAKDNVGVTSVLFQLNGGLWVPAITTNGYTNWSANLNLSPGTNTLKAYALDGNNNGSITNTVSFVYVVSAVLTVNTNGHGTLSPNYNGALLEIDKSYTMKATAATGFTFTGWSGSTNSTNATLTFLMDSNLTFTANFMDIVPPTVTITTPTSGQVITNSPLTVSGKAGDNVAVTNVYYSVSGSTAVSAQTANNWTNWTASVDLALGSNVIQVYSVDSSGLHSAVQTVTVIHNPVLTAFPIASAANIDNPQAQIAFDGSNYLVAFQTHPDGPTNGSADVAQFISPTGNLVGGLVVPLTNGDAPCLAFDGNNYLMASWTSTQSGSFVQGAFVSPDGSVGSPGQLTQSTTVDSFGTMVYGGGVYFLMWADYGNSATNGGVDDIFGAMVTPDGTIAASDFEISPTGELSEAGQGAAAFDGTNFLATWGSASGITGISGRLISPAGNFITDPFIIYTNKSTATTVNISCAVFDGTKYLVLFNDGLGSGSTTGWHIEGRFVTTAGEVLTNAISVTGDAGPQIVPCAAFDGTHYLITWNQGFNPFGSSAGSIKARFFDVNGNPIAPEFPLFTPATGQTALWAPALFDGARFFSVAGLGHELTSAPNLKFTNGVISGVFISP